MKERPIIFSSSMVQAILDGRKTMARCILFPRAPAWIEEFGFTNFTPRGYISGRATYRDEGLAEKFFKLKYGVVGDRLWVRETFWAKHDIDGEDGQILNCGPCLDIGPDHHPGIQYCASPESQDPPDGVDPLGEAAPGCWWEGPPDDWDGESDYKGKGLWVFLGWSEGFFSKLSPLSMPRWASRLTLEITSVGVERLQSISYADCVREGVPPVPCYDDSPEPETLIAATRDLFRERWDSINSQRTGCTWADNTWVFVIGFKRIEEP
jgi:hypothetical protein